MNPQTMTMPTPTRMKGRFEQPPCHARTLWAPRGSRIPITRVRALARPLGIALALGALSAGCGFERRSSSLSCSVSADCPDDRRCVEGWCLARADDAGGDRPVDATAVVDGDLVDTGAVDAPGPTADAPPCPSVCSRCELDVCVISCEASGACPGQVTCPAGLRCRVDCNGTGSCAGGVDCRAATACDVRCGGDDACGDAVDCAAGPCAVVCSGAASCALGVDCRAACACDVACGGPGSCPVDPSCPGPGTCDLSPGCRSGPGPCHHACP
jgi:hypothetical protein